MKQHKEKSINELYKQHITLIISVITAVIICVFILLFIILYKSNSNNRLINILGRQRMLTQMVAKDVGTLYELKIYGNDNTEINKTTNEIKEAVIEYDKQLETIKDGYVISDGRVITFKGAIGDLSTTISEHEKMWVNFKTAVDIVLMDKNNSSQYQNAIKYINENNEILLEYSDDITTMVLDYNNKRNLHIYYIVMILPLTMLIFLVIFIKRAYRDLFLPITLLSRGVSELGLIIEDHQEVLGRGRDLSSDFAEVKFVLNQFNGMISLMENLSRNIPFKENLEYIFNTFSKYIPYTYIGVALIDEQRENITATYAMAGEYHKNLPGRVLGTKVPLSETSLSRIVEIGKERVINDLEEHVKRKPLKEYNRILLEEGIRSSITFPLKNNDEVIGIIFFSSNTKDVYNCDHVRFLKTLSNSIMLNLDKDILIDDMIISSTLALAKLTEERDNETGEHLQRMKAYSRMLAEFLSKEEKYKNLIDINYINDIERFAPLHDVGKVAIRDEILLKPGKLTEEEFEMMKTHASYGGRVLRIAEENLNKRGRSIYRMAIQIAEGHHEKWDGSGYPYGKQGEEIPLSARIVAMADVFDALTSARPYKKPFSFEESVKMITDGRERHFDPELVDVFTKNLDKIREKYLEFNSI